MSGKIFVWLLATVLLTTASPADAQQAKKVQRIGFLGSGTLGQFVAFRQSLRDLGYVEGKSITIEYPKPEGNFSRAPARAAELLRLKVDVIVTSGATDTRAAKEATTTIPIVFLASKERADAVFVLGFPGPLSERTLLAQHAVKTRLPAIYPQINYVEEAGGLMSYGTSFAELERRAATYVDKILKGAKPADLPVEQPKKFELVINLKAAKQIGLVVPPNVLARADKVIR